MNGGLNGDARGRQDPCRPPWDPGRAQETLGNLALLALAGAEIEALMGEVAEVVGEVLRAELVSVMEATPDRGELVLRAGVGWGTGEVGKRSIPVGIDDADEHVSMAGYALLSRDPVRVEDLRSDPRFGGCPLMRAHGALSGAMAKIYVRGRLFGVLGAHSRVVRDFRPEEAAWLADAANVLGGALARETADGGNGAHSRRVLRDAMEIIASSSGGREALVAAAKVAVARLADWCFVDLLEERDGVPGFTAGDKIRRIAVGARPGAGHTREIAEELSYPLNPTAPHNTPKVLRTGRPELIPVVTDGVLRESANDEGHLRALRLLDPKSCMTVPMSISGRNVGALVLVSTDPDRRYEDADVEAAEDLARCAALVLAGFASAHPAAAEAALPADPPPGLSRRQAEILRLLHDGHSRKQIAVRFYCTEETVRWHIKRIKTALGVRDRGDGALLAAARKAGLFGDPS